MASDTASPRVYVGTYAKYNGGSIGGAWLDLDDYSDHDAFMEAARALHEDEADPELMFQDYEGFPAGYYGESSIKPELWDWIALSADERETVAAYHHGVEQDRSIEECLEAFMGKADTEADWAETFLEETGGLEGIPDHLRNYIDFAAYARDARLGGDVVSVRYEGTLYVFSNN